MNFYEYLQEARRTAATPSTTVIDKEIFHSFCGLQTEFGELIDEIKEHVFYKTPLDTSKIKKELGDILWYLNLPVFNLIAISTSEEDLKNLCDHIETGDSALTAPLVSSAVSAADELQTGKGNPELFPVGTFWLLSSGLSTSIWKLNHHYIQAMQMLEEYNVSRDEKMLTERYPSVLQDITIGILMIYHNVKALSIMFGLLVEDVMETNINKLKVRFPDAFDASKAVDRDLEAEDAVE